MSNYDNYRDAYTDDQLERAHLKSYVVWRGARGGDPRQVDANSAEKAARKYVQELILADVLRERSVLEGGPLVIYVCHTYGLCGVAKVELDVTFNAHATPAAAPGDSE